MEQPPRRRRHGQGSNAAGGRTNAERRAALTQMMADNRESLGMKVIAVMVERYRVLPEELWNLNSISDMGAGRGFKYQPHLSEATHKRIIENDRYSILNMTIGKDITGSGFSRGAVDLPSGLLQLKVEARRYPYPLVLPVTLKELIFDGDCVYQQPLVFPAGLRKLTLGNFFNLPLNFPPTLVELELGSEYRQPLHLPQTLKRLRFHPDSHFNLPLALPPNLKTIQFGDSCNQLTTLPTGIEEIRVGRHFTRDLSFPSCLRRLEWCCDRPVQIPEGVSEVVLCEPFDQPIVLPESLKKVTFAMDRYFRPINFPIDLKELTWRVDEYAAGLVLPFGLQKLAWASHRPIMLLLSLRELVIEKDAALVLPEELVKVTFGYVCSRHYNLPESVREVIWSSLKSSFTHPTTLHHLTVNTEDGSCNEIDFMHVKVHKLTIGDRNMRIKEWPQGLKELAFTVRKMEHPLHVPKGCRIVGGKPENVIMA